MRRTITVVDLHTGAHLWWWSLPLTPHQADAAEAAVYGHWRFLEAIVRLEGGRGMCTELYRNLVRVAVRWDVDGVRVVRSGVAAEGAE